MKGVIVAAGYGTRFFPITKTVPKEMLPLYDKPLIDFILDEFEAAGIRDVVMITSRRKKVMDDYFDREVELENVLNASGKTELANRIKPRDMNILCLRQQEMKGTGHALLLTASIIGDEPFVVAYPDDIVIHEPGVTAKMIELYNKTGCSVLAAREETVDVTRYGVLMPEYKNGLIYAKGIVEKPKKEDAPSSLVSIGRYLFSPEFLPLLKEYYSKFTGKGEFYHIDTIMDLARREKVLAYEVEGLMLDTGEPQSYFNSLLMYAFRHPSARKILDGFVKEHYAK